MSHSLDRTGNMDLAADGLAEAYDELTSRMQSGEVLDAAEVRRRFPQHAEELLRLLPAVAALDELSVAQEQLPGHAQPAVPPVLGDFRILHEVGRGGMGIVYEAEQVSLGRRVALKVLPLAGTLDQRQLQRFKNEARAAAQLHHTNIVPVHFVGCDHGVHYYAMEFIDGHSLAEVIDQLRRERGDHQQDPQLTTAYAPTPPVPAEGAQNGTAAGAQVTRAEPSGQAETKSATPGSGLSRSAYFSWVAQLGEQAALALEHAHQFGVLHRDIKPANLMLDIRGNVWVTDFGLAHLPGDQRLTMTGDLLGTLRYMSPEQALAQRVTIDERTDVYSLGVTLYELLTLEPAYSGKDRQELLRQIAFEEPKAPRRLDRTIPVELETIVLKAMAKAPDERYTTARELADDLRHWLEDRPIRARRPPVWLRMRRWGRRHRPLVAAAAAAMLMGLLVAAASLGWVANDRATRRSETTKVIQAALAEAADWQEQGRLPEALSAARRARGLLAGANVEPELEHEVEGRCAELELVDRLQAVSLARGAVVKDGHFDHEAEERVYEQEFRAAGLDLDALGIEEMAARIRASSVPVELAGVLDNWSLARRICRGKQDHSWEALLQVACLADPDAWRTRLRHAMAAKNRAELGRVAASADIAHLPATTLNTLAVALQDIKDTSAATESFLRAAQRRYPDDFWLNNAAVKFFSEAKRGDFAEAVGFARVAVGIRPRSVAARFNLGVTLLGSGQLDEAICEYREAIRLKKDFADAHHGLGAALYHKGRLDEAIAEDREAIRLKEDYPEAHCALGAFLGNNGRLDEAIAELRRAIRLKKDDADAHNSLGVVLRKKGLLDEAIAEYRETIRLRKDDADAHRGLADALAEKGRLDEAILEFHEAIRLKKDYAVAYVGLGVALHEKGQLEEAIAELRCAIRLKKDCAPAHNALGAMLSTKGLQDEAIAEFREAIRLEDTTEAHHNLGRALSEKGRLNEAIAEWRKAIRLRQDNASAHCGLGTALRKKGLLNDAIGEFCEAIRLKKDFAEAHAYLGDALRAKGLLDDAIAEWREAIRLKKDLAEAHNNLGEALREKGRLDEGIGELHEAIRLNKNDAIAHYNLGIALGGKGQLDQAVAEYRVAIELRADCAEPHCNLASILMGQGRFREAVAEFRRGHALGSRQPGWHYPSDQWVQHAEVMAQLNDRLAEVLAGKAKPKDAAERVDMAGLAQQPYKSLYATAARLYDEAFTAQSKLAEDMEEGHRYNAACAAALAGCGKGKDAGKLTSAERARLRQQAFTWLQAHLRAYRLAIDQRQLPAANIAARLQHWLVDDDLTGVRLPQALARFPEAERRDWQKLWQDVEALRQFAARGGNKNVPGPKETP